MSRILSIIVSVLMLSGCKVGGDIDKKYLNKVFTCVDFRDGEKFKFNTNTIKNATIGYFGGSSCFEFTTIKGEERMLCTPAEEYIKCKQITVKID